MKYICDVTGRPIPAGQNVELSISPRGDSELINDFNKNRKHLSRRYMIREGVVEKIIEAIDNGVLYDIINNQPNNTIDTDNHRNHRHPVRDCDQCTYEEFHEIPETKGVMEQFVDIFGEVKDD